MKKYALQLLLAASIISISTAFSATITNTQAVAQSRLTTGIAAQNLLLATNGKMKYSPVSTNAAAYFTLTNTSDQDVIITSAALLSLDTSSVELHNTSVDANGVYSMAKVDKIVIPAKGSIEFKPGGTHVMIMGLKNLIKNGDTVKLTLNFADGKSQDILTTIQ